MTQHKTSLQSALRENALLSTPESCEKASSFRICSNERSTVRKYMGTSLGEGLKGDPSFDL